MTDTRPRITTIDQRLREAREQIEAMKRKPPTWAELSRALEVRVTEATDCFMNAARTNPGRRFYLYYREAVEGELCGELLAFMSDPDPRVSDGWKQATPEPIPSDRDWPGVRFWIREHVNGVPILGS